MFIQQGLFDHRNMSVMSPCCLIAGILYVSVGLVVHEGVGPLKQQKRRIVSIFLGLISA